jgi:predicted outer membrane repeat protein
MHCYDTTLKINNCSFTANSGWASGGITCSSVDATITNCSFIANSAIGTGIGGAINFTSANASVNNCTFSQNSASDKGGGISCDSSSNAIVKNSIFWANTAPTDPQIYDPDYSHSDYTYCNIQGGWLGLGNINVDPCFVEPGYWDPNGTPTDANDDFWVDGDYHLKSSGWRWDSTRSRWDYDEVTSRCIDTGNPGSALADEPLIIPDDPNNIWGHNLRINMGAYGGTAEASMAPYDWALLCDIDNNGTADLKDFAWLSSLWPKQGDELFADFNRDTTVEANDLDLFIEDWLEVTSWH